MLKITHHGSFINLENFLQKNAKLSPRILSILDRYGRMGVVLLARATPVDTGKTAASWSYKVNKTTYGYRISWTNSNIVNGVPIAMILQYGHGTGNGGYVQGRDYINPITMSLFEKLREDLWKEIIS